MAGVGAGSGQAPLTLHSGVQPARHGPLGQAAQRSASVSSRIRVRAIRGMAAVPARRASGASGARMVSTGPGGGRGPQGRRTGPRGGRTGPRGEEQAPGERDRPQGMGTGPRGGGKAPGERDRPGEGGQVPGERDRPQGRGDRLQGPWNLADAFPLSLCRVPAGLLWARVPAGVHLPPGRGLRPCQWRVWEAVSRWLPRGGLRPR